MTARPISVMFQTGAANTQIKGSSKSNEADKSIGFGQMLNQFQNPAAAKNVSSGTADQMTAKKEDASLGQDTVKQQKTDAKVEENKEAAVSEELKDKISSVEEKIKSAIKDALGISEEELENAMALLGFNFMDLLDNNNFTQLFLNLTGSENMLSLITDENLYQSFNRLSELFEGLQTDLLEEFDLNPEELKTVLTLLEQSKEPEKQAQASVETIGNTEQKPVLDSDGETDSQEVTKEKEIIPGTENTSETDTKKKDMSGDSSKEQMNFMQSENRTVIHHSPLERVVYTQKTDSYGIVEQVVEQVKVMVKEDLTSIEMQLNPESLGKLTLQVASRQGVITAHIEVRTDAAKDLVEAQMAQLKESMNQQGLKIEAVEVTIASHAFENNLEQKDQSKEEADGGEKASKNQEGDGIEVEEAEEEAIEDTIRKAQGNLINFKA